MPVTSQREVFGRHVYGTTWRYLKVLDEKNSLCCGKRRDPEKLAPENANMRAGSSLFSEIDNNGGII
jgi:hypothetical protein